MTVADGRSAPLHHCARRRTPPSEQLSRRNGSVVDALKGECEISFAHAKRNHRVPSGSAYANQLRSSVTGFKFLALLGGVRDRAMTIPP